MLGNGIGEISGNLLDLQGTFWGGKTVKVIIFNSNTTWLGNTGARWNRVGGLREFS